MKYIPAKNRYEKMFYRRCGKSGLLFPILSLGLWHNFGNITPIEVQQNLLRTAFDNGITHFDLANNYGPPYGEAEKNFGLHMERDWKSHRDELLISTKAGYDMWEGPYGNHGSKKYLMASLDQSLKRMHLDYVDIFYHHRPDPDTPLEETMEALATIVKSGKALYVGVSNYYSSELTKRSAQILERKGLHLLVNQVRYSMFDRRIEGELQDQMEHLGVGGVAFAPLQNGLLTDKYIRGIPEDSRAVRDPRYLKPEDVTQEKRERIVRLNEIAKERGQTLAQMALVWTLRNPVMCTALIGASRPEQIEENIKIIDNLQLDEEEERAIEKVLFERK